MSHFGRAGPPDIRDTYSLLILNITFRTTADDLFPLFDKYGKVVDIFIPRDKRTGDSRGFAFVRYKHAEEAQKAVDRLDGRIVDGREIVVQFAKYGPNAEPIQRGRISHGSPKWSDSRSRSPRGPSRRYRDDTHSSHERDYRRRSHSRDRYTWDSYRERGRGYRRRSASYSPSYSRGRADEERKRSRSTSPERLKSPDGNSSSPANRSPPVSRRSRYSHSISPRKRSPSPGRSALPEDRRKRSHSSSPGSRSPSPRNSDAEK
eukprot:c29029_g1_i2 orf=201-986(+)